MKKASLGKLIDTIDGIKIYIYGGDHNPPHFHTVKADVSALISIQTLEVLEGTISGKDLKKVQEWAGARRNLLIATFRELNPNLR